MIRQPEAILLIGPPGAGKTTWRDSYMCSAPANTVVLSTDDLIEAWATERGLTYAEARRQVDFTQMETAMKAAFRDAVSARRDLVIDRTNLRIASRRKWLANLPGYRRIAVVFEVPEDELRRRLAHRAATGGKFVSPKLLAGMLASYEPPAADEFDEIVRV